MQREPEQETKGGTGSAGLTITVRIPMPLRKLTGEESVVAGEGSTLGECIEGLEARYPGMKERLCDDTGDLRRFVNVYVNGEDVRLSRLKPGREDAGLSSRCGVPVSGFRFMY